MNKDMVRVGFSTDDRYAQHTGVTIYSLLKNCSDPKKIQIFITDGGISSINKKRLKKISKKFKAKMSFIKPDRKHFKGLKFGGHLSESTYHRLLLPNILKKGKIIYLDSDMIVEGDILELSEISLGNKTLGATRELHRPEYFNSGLMVIDCESWIKNKVFEKTLDLARNHPEKINPKSPEQDALNYALGENIWMALPYEWNVSPYCYNNPELVKTVGITESKRILNHPKIVHYVWPVKPWSFAFYHRTGRLYWHYLSMTPWKDYKVTDISLRNLTLKTLAIITSPIPLHIRTKILNVARKMKLIKL